MRLLLDTHIVLAIVNETPELLPASYRRLVDDKTAEFWCSVASLWEIAIKFRINKLELVVPLDNLDGTCRSYNLDILSIEPHHVLAELSPLPATRDPFDRLLLAQASVEGMRLVTLDRALIGHPLVWAPPHEQPAP